ncbi:MAG: ABC transporter substrate-binding protein [Nitrososphaerota archaeon]
MSGKTGRRDFLKGLVGGLVAGAVVGVAGTELYRGIAAPPPPAVKEPVPTTPIKAGIQAYLTGGGAIWGKPMMQGAVLAIEEINERGGILGRKIEYVVKPETSPEETVREYRTLVLDEKIDFYVGLISSSNTPAVGPVAEELQKLSFFVDGCTDFLFESVVPDPRFCFRITNIQSADGISAALGAIKLLNLMEKDKVRIAHIHPDYAYGRNAHAHMQITFEKVLGKDRVEVVYEAFPGLFKVTDFTPYITEIIASKPDILASSLWGADVVNFYKQALGYGLFDKMKFVSCIAHGASPAEAVKDFPDGHIAGVHANYFFLYPEWDKYPINKAFVENYYKRWGTYPDSPAEGAYVAVYMYKTAVEKAYEVLGKWPEVDDIIKMLEGMTIYGPAGPIHIRARKPNKHQCYKDGIVGLSKYDPRYGFSVLTNPVVIPISRITVPEGWEGTPDPKAGTLAYSWIRETWKEGVLPV